MDALELLKKWPTWEKANAATVLASPAWRMPVKFDGRDASLRLVDAPAERDAISLAVKFDGEEHILGIFDTSRFSDLHLLWQKRDGLPGEIVLALVEKECGVLLQFLEDTVRKELSVEGLRTGEPPVCDKVFLLESGGDSIMFFTFPCFHHALWAVGLSGHRSQGGVWDARCHLRNNTSESRTGQREERNQASVPAMLPQITWWSAWSRYSQLEQTKIG